jgi:hypothetical protein
LDEDVPKPLLPGLQRVLTEHDVVHVDDLQWKSKKDLNLLTKDPQVDPPAYWPSKPSPSRRRSTRRR